ncbi:MAG: DUF4340 domain-containing protein [Deltaproteobacteria bacterium]|nr:DUF4340 domain-containing protein [Deltaproteobacteria bacterium]
MKRNINILVGLLAIQIALFFYLNIAEEDKGAPASDPLLTLEWNKVDKITVEDSDKKTMEIVKKEGKWILPSFFDFPVNEDKIRETLETLASIKKTWPVGNTTVAAKQFEVVDDKFERRISYHAGDSVQTLYLGTSPGYRKVHTRANKEDHTYSIDFNAFDVPANAKDWLDREVYKLDRSKLSLVQLPHIVLKQDAGNFVIADLKEGETTNTTESDALINKVMNPRFDEVLASGQYDHGPQVYEYSATTSENVTRTFTFSEMKGDAKPNKEPTKEKEKKERPIDQSLVLKVSDLPYYFSINKNFVEGLKETDRAKFVKAEEKQEEKKS